MFFVKSETSYHLVSTCTRFVAVNALPADQLIVDRLVKSGAGAIGP